MLPGFAASTFSFIAIASSIFPALAATAAARSSTFMFSGSSCCAFAIASAALSGMLRAR